MMEHKKQIAENGKATEDSTVQLCDMNLADESVILENDGKYRTLVEKEKELIEGTAIYKTKSSELDRINTQISGAEEVIRDYQRSLAKYEAELKSVKS